MIRNLQRRNPRRRGAEAVLEGVRLVEEALGAEGVAFHGSAVSPALTTTARGRALASALAGFGIEPERLSDADLAGLADTETPQGIIAVVTPRTWTLDDIEPRTGEPALVLDGVQDPGNAGTLMRTAWALHGCGVIALPGSALPTHPKVLRASMGAAFHIPVVRATDDDLAAWLTRTKTRLVGLDSSGDPIPDRIGGPVALMVGNEGAGMREHWRDRVDQRWAVPMDPSAESLNVAVAAGIAFHEVHRDR